MTDERAIDILYATMGTSPIEGQSEANEMAPKTSAKNSRSRNPKGTFT